MTGHQSPYPSAADQRSSNEQTPARTLTITTPRIIVGCVALAIVAAAFGFLGYLTLENQSRAEDWKTRTEETQSILNKRTKELNRQTARLNKTAKLLREANRDVKRSEADVASLEVRQAELATEKAAIEDERAYLQSMAGSLASCNGAIVESLDWVGTTYGPPAYILEDVAAFCGQARNQMDSYAASFG